jgi:hypothetical protein
MPDFLEEKIAASFQLVVDGTHMVEPWEVADAFGIYFQLVHNSASPGVFPSLSSPSEFLSLSPISVSDIFKTL